MEKAQIFEIGVAGHDDKVVGLGVVPDRPIGRPVKADQGDVGRLGKIDLKKRRHPP